MKNWFFKMNYYFVVEYVRSMSRQCPSPPHFSPQIKDDSFLAYKAFLGCEVTKFCMVTKTAVKKSKLIKIARNRISKVNHVFQNFLAAYPGPLWPYSPPCFPSCSAVPVLDSWLASTKAIRLHVLKFYEVTVDSCLSVVSNV